MKTFFIVVGIVFGSDEIFVAPSLQKGVTKQFQTREDCEQALFKRLDNYEGQWIAEGPLGKTLYGDTAAVLAVT